MLENFWSLPARDWVFIVLFDMVVLYIGYNLGKQDRFLD